MPKDQISHIDPSEYLFSLPFSDTPADAPKVAFLVPELDLTGINKHYIQPLKERAAGLEHECLGVSLYRPKKAKRIDIKAYLDFLMPQLSAFGVRYLMIGDAEYFRVLSGNQGPENNLGHILESPTAWPGFKIIYCPNYKLAFSSPIKTGEQIAQALHALTADVNGHYTPPGDGIIKHATYPHTPQDIEATLNYLYDLEEDLDADIETFSLKHWEAGIGSIGFSWSMHEGASFAVDLLTNPQDRLIVRNLLKHFFNRWFRRAQNMHAMGRRAPRITWHNAGFDITVIIYQLFMKNLIDQEGLLEGLAVMTEAFDDTKIVAYLALNSCAGNTLGLKPLSQEYTGKYAISEINNIRAVPLDKLLRYNLIDCLATRFVKNTYWHRMVADDQLTVYEELLKPSLIDIIQMQLTGMPLNMQTTIEVKNEMEAIRDGARAKMKSLVLLSRFDRVLRERAAEKYNATHVKKRKTWQDFSDPEDKSYIEFNPGSPDQLQEVLYDKHWLHLPVLGYSDAGNPTTKGDFLSRLIHHTDDEEAKTFIEALVEWKKVSKILNDFIPKFLKAPQGPDGWHYFFGNFNIGGTVSGRLSSSGPNLQNLPSGGKFGKLIKSCFQAPPGKIFCGLDFASLEDRISALTTRDPNKLKVYTDGYDGHSLRAYSYFGDQMPDIDPNSVESINSIAKSYKNLRQDSKTPTFLLTYDGTHFGIVEQMGWTTEKALNVEEKFKELYKASIQWVEGKREEAAKRGYAVLAFGLRLRTPILQQVILGNRKTPYEAKQEARTMGNALGQSWGLLNNRASVEFMRKVRADPAMRLKIRPSAHIHDAQYFIMDEDMAALLFMNEHLVKAVEWQDDPLIYHDKVKLGGEVSIFYPTWANEMEIPNGADASKVRELAQKHLNDLEKEKLAA